MSSIEVMNSQLHRTLKSGEQYNQYFSNASCNERFLGEGVTTFGLHMMKECTNLFYKQTERIAKILLGNSLQSTVLNIKQFLYDHIQYDADGFEQNLRSPNCSWASRTEGIDCKSYSLSAGCILKVLQIPFSYRKITQSRSPEKWSHVYVVVKDVNGKELIIDATVPINREVPKIKKEDVFMEAKLPYYALNGAEENGSETVSNFRGFLANLNKAGVLLSVTQKIENEVRKSTDKGLDPKIDLKPTHIVINKIVIPYGVTLNSPAGLGFLDPATLGAVTGVFSSLFGSKADPAKIQAEYERLYSTYVGVKVDSAKRMAMQGDINGAIALLEKDIAIRQSQINKYDSPNSIEPRKMIIADHNKLISTFKGATSNTTTQAPINNTFNPNLGNNTPLNINGLIQLANGLFQNPQTGEIVTTPYQTGAVATQNQNVPPKEDEGMSVTTKVAIGGALAVVGAMVYTATKK